MYILYAQGVLSCQCSRSRHCITSVGCNDLLICFQTAVGLWLADPYQFVRFKQGAYAPPELSEPAITSIRFGDIGNLF
jgi:hypothetical protein